MTTQIGPYTIQQLLGSGGMADVYLAWDHANRWPVALKVLRATPGPDTRLLKRFEREAELLMKLRHPHIIQVYDAGRTADGRTWIAMEYVNGGDLYGLVHAKRGSRLPVVEAVYLMRRVAGAMAYAHERGIVHRDLKPSNILLRADTGEPVIADLGIAALAGAKPLTGTMEAMGTPQYMAPEQGASHGEADGRVDVYAIGVMLFELLGGRPPFEAENGWAMLLRKQQEAAPPILSIRRDLDPRLAAVVDACLQRDPAARYQTAGALAAALDAFLPADARPPAPVAAKGRGGAATPLSPTSVPIGPPSTASRRQPSTGRRMLPWLALVGVAIVAALVFLPPAFGGNRAGGTPPVTTAAGEGVGVTPVDAGPEDATAESVVAAAEPTSTLSSASNTAPAPTQPPSSLTPLPTPAPQVIIIVQTPTSVAPAETTALVSRDVYTRTGPGLDFPILGGLSADERVVLLGQDARGDWYMVDSASGPVWVSDNYLTEISGPPPVVEAAEITSEPATATPTHTRPAATALASGTATTSTATPKPAGTSSSTTGPVALSGFEAFGQWRIGDEPNGTFAQSSEQAHGGTFSGKLDYNFPDPANNYVVFTQARDIPGTPNALRLWVYGDASGHLLNLWIADSENQVWSVPMGTVRHTGWQQMTGRIDADQGWPGGHISGPNNGQIDYPIRFNSVVLDDASDDYTGQGVIYLDDLSADVVEEEGS